MDRDGVNMDCIHALTAVVFQFSALNLLMLHTVIMLFNFFLKTSWKIGGGTEFNDDYNMLYDFIHPVTF
jgi:hypothetical protein